MESDLNLIKKEIDKLHDLEVRLESFKYSLTSSDNMMKDIISSQNRIMSLL
jgi:hypothetical protein